MRTFLVTALRALASLKLAIFLLLALAAVLAVATLLETAHGRQYAGWYVYHSRWFVALLGLLAGNILAATAVRFPRKRRQIGFVLTHVGLLILLGGAVWTFRSGIDGQLVLAEGETGDRMMLPDTSRFDVQWAGQPRKDRLPAVFTFQAGPVDWPEDETLELGSVSGVGLKVVHYLRHARSVDNWVPEEAGSGPAVLKVSMTGPEAASGVETWLPASPMEANIGSARFAFFQAEAETLSEDFLHPPVADLGPDGLLAIHYDGKVQRVGVKENLGKKISLSADGTAVVIAEYLPNAVPQLDGRQVSAGIAPKNPLLELRIYLPKKKDPQRQMVFAKHPCLNLDGINGRVCPVKFWYHHPAVKAEPGVEFLAVPSGKLYCRIGGEGKWNSRGEVKAGDRIPAWASTAVWLVKHFPHARQEVRYLPVLPDAAGADSAPAAALLEVAAGGAKHLLWLQQGEPGQMPHPLKTAAGMLHVGFSFDTRPLGFALRLKKFIHQLNPGGTGDAAFASAVQVLDAAGKIVQEREISMNQPLVCKDFMVCQSGFLPDGQGSILGVSRDPGMFLKYLGAAMVCLARAVDFHHPGEDGPPRVGRFRLSTADGAKGILNAQPHCRLAGLFRPLCGGRTGKSRRRVRLEALALPARPRPRPPKTLRQPRLGKLANDRQSQWRNRSADRPQARRRGALSLRALRLAGLGAEARRATSCAAGAMRQIAFHGRGHGRLSRPRRLLPARPLGPVALDPRRIARIAPRLGHARRAETHLALRSGQVSVSRSADAVVPAIFRLGADLGVSPGGAA